MNDEVARALDFFVAEQKRLEPTAFVARYADPVLVRRRLPQEADDEHTSTTVIAVGRGANFPSESHDLVVVPVRKKDGGAYAERIGVGRTRATDVWLPVPDVSKYHAYFELVPGRTLLTDAGSKNGTYVNAERLRAREPAQLGDTALLRFGGCEARFCSAMGFFRFLTHLKST